MIPGGYQVKKPVLGCKIPGCPGKHEALGYCSKHYQRLTKAGSLADPRSTLADADRLWAQAERAADGSGCLLWTGAIMKSGYSQIWWNGKTEGAHRVAWMLAAGRPIPDGFDIDHVRDNGCRHTECIEPAHLEAIPAALNRGKRNVITDARRAQLSAAGRKGSESRWRGIVSPTERLWASTERADDGSGCLLWTGYVSKKTGYGQLNWRGKTRLVHRVAYELVTGMPILPGHDVDHVRERGCRHKHCIEPAHLEAVPMKLDRGRRAHPAVPREVLPERLDGPGRRRRSSAAQTGVTKADPALVAIWKARYAADESQSALGREYGVSQTTVGRAINGTR